MLLLVIILSTYISQYTQMCGGLAPKTICLYLRSTSDVFCPFHFFNNKIMINIYLSKRMICLMLPSRHICSRNIPTLIPQFSKVNGKQVAAAQENRKKNRQVKWMELKPFHLNINLRNYFVLKEYESGGILVLFICLSIMTVMLFLR